MKLQGDEARAGVGGGMVIQLKNAVGAQADRAGDTGPPCRNFTG